MASRSPARKRRCSSGAGGAAPPSCAPSGVGPVGSLMLLPLSVAPLPITYPAIPYLQRSPHPPCLDSLCLCASVAKSPVLVGHQHQQDPGREEGGAGPADGVDL